MRDQAWTLFLDRDGIVNERIVNGYVQNADQFIFIDHFLEAMVLLRPQYGRIILVSNQQGIGKGICQKEKVDEIHAKLQNLLRSKGAQFDKIYYCPHLASQHCTCRKPQTGMAWQAKEDFPEIDFAKSVMVGDSLTDMHFARNAGMLPVHVGAIEHPEFEEILSFTDYHFDNLYDFAKYFKISASGAIAAGNSNFY